MKTRLLLASLLLFAVPAFADKAEDYYQAGLTAVNRGEAEVARTAFTNALRARPGHAQARYQLGQIDLMKDVLTERRRTRELQAIRLPQINFAGVPFSDALQALAQMIETESKKMDEKNPVVANFMISDPSGKLADREVRLQLKKVPAKIAFEYLLAQAGAIARYDEHAIVVKPAASASKSKESASVK